MSLGKLLTTGKSLMGAHGEAHRFRVNKRVALPKFVSPKNPFASGAQQARAEARLTAAFPTEATARATNAPAPPAALRKLSPVRAIQWMGEVGQKLNPMALLKRQPAAASGAAARVVAPIQRELSLDTVRVLRNDLSDADAEAAVGSAKLPQFRNSAVLAVTARAEVAMDRISSKFFGAGEV